MAWLPGTEGQGVADVLFGDADATGRLSRSWPRTTTQEPINYDHRPGEKYDPLFEFGYGLSYTNFNYTNLNVTPTNPSPTDVLNISVKVTNIGTRSGREVVQVYANDVASTLSTPVRKLYRAEKTPTLAAGDTTTLNFSIPASELGFYTDNENKILENGTFKVMVGGLTHEFVIGQISGDVDENGIVNILDLFIVARAFGSKPEDFRWNPIADSDGNNIIDLVDITFVARNFGRTA
jgi:beta-glucosidase